MVIATGERGEGVGSLHPETPETKDGIELATMSHVESEGAGLLGESTADEELPLRGWESPSHGPESPQQ